MNRCSILLEYGQPCNMPTIVFYEEYGEYICLDHAPQHYRPGDMVNLHDTPRDGYVLALGHRRGMITRLLARALYEVYCEGDSMPFLLYDWELEPAWAPEPVWAPEPRYHAW